MRPPPLAVVLLVAFGSFTVARASPLDDITWTPDEEIAAPVTEVSTGSSPAAVWVDGGWAIVYASAGEIWFRAHNGSAWEAPVQLSHDPSPSRDPHIALMPNRLFVVWEDERAGHPEIWCAVRTGGVWGAETSLTADATPSRHPAIAAAYAEVFVVWADGDAGNRSVFGRPWFNGQWGAVESVTAGPAEEFEPAITLDEYFGLYRVVWTDARHSVTQIYGRARVAYGNPWWESESRLSALPTACRRPSPQANNCCGDAIMIEGTLLFESGPEGATEIYAECNWADNGLSNVRVSPNDAVASSAPCASGFGFLISGCMPGGDLPKYLHAWSDELPGGRIQPTILGHRECFYDAQTAPVSPQAIGGVLAASVRGNPEAHHVVMWIEDRAGQPALIARRGSESGCWNPTLDPPSFALVSPGGSQATVVRAYDTCSGRPQPWQDVLLDFSGCHELTWSQDQPHPRTELLSTNAEGEAVFHVRAGGCEPDGEVVALWCGFFPFEFQGVRSPDVNGDCLVGYPDLRYVQDRLGTSDFCADLDGSGLVDTADVGLVRRTQGEHCSQIPASGAPETPDAVTHPQGLSLQVQPNPCRTFARLRVGLRGRGSGAGLGGVADPQGGAADPAGGAGHDGGGIAPADLAIVDVQGRVLRRFDLSSSTDPRGITWDTRDAEGRLVPSGLYGVIVRQGERRTRQALLVVR